MIFDSLGLHGRRRTRKNDGSITLRLCSRLGTDQIVRLQTTIVHGVFFFWKQVST